MFSVGPWTPTSRGLCIFAVAKFLVLATEELDCSRRGLQRLPTELDARFASFCVGQANKQRAVALRQQNNASHAVSLQRTHSTSFASIAPDLDVRSSARTRRNPRVLACLLPIWPEVLRGNHNTRHLRRSYSMAGQTLIARTQRVPFSTVGLPRPGGPAGGNFVARRSRSPCLPRRPRLRRSCS